MSGHNSWDFGQRLKVSIAVRHSLYAEEYKTYASCKAVAHIMKAMHHQPTERIWGATEPGANGNTAS